LGKYGSVEEHGRKRLCLLEYPRGLEGKKIPLTSRILSIVDAYDVMIYGRPYKKKMTKEQAIGELQKFSGTQFDPELAGLFIDILNE